MTKYLDTLVARSLGKAEIVQPSIAPLFANEGHDDSPRQSLEPEWEADISHTVPLKPSQPSPRRPADNPFVGKMIQSESPAEGPELSPLPAERSSRVPIPTVEDIEDAPVTDNSPSVPRDGSEQAIMQSPINDSRLRAPLVRLNPDDRSPSSEEPPVPGITTPKKDPVAPSAPIREGQPSQELATALHKGTSQPDFLRHETQQSPKKQTDDSPAHEGELVVSPSRVKSLLDRQRTQVQTGIEHSSETFHQVRRDGAAHTQMKPSEPTIHVTIGRVEVRAITSPQQIRKAVREDRPTMTLEAYLQRRAGERST